jgi:hypothetical protein
MHPMKAVLLALAQTAHLDSAGDTRSSKELVIPVKRYRAQHVRCVHEVPILHRRLHLQQSVHSLNSLQAPITAHENPLTLFQERTHLDHQGQFLCGIRVSSLSDSYAYEQPMLRSGHGIGGPCHLVYCDASAHHPSYV